MLVRVDRCEDWFIFEGRSRFGLRESLRAQGTSVHYSRCRGPFRVQAEQFELFEMKSLLMAVSTYTRPQGVPLEDKAAWQGAPKHIAGPTLRFWYKVRTYHFGYSLDYEEAAQVAHELLAYDAGKRQSLGLDTEKGLSDPSELTAARMALVMSGLEDTPTDRMGRFMG